MQLGLVTYNWGAQLDLPTLVKNLQLTNFAGVELRSGHKHGVEPSISTTERHDVAKRFSDAGLTIVGMGSACEFHSPDAAVLRKQIDDCKKFIVLAHDIGGSGVKVRPNGLPKGVSEEKTLTQIGHALRECGEFGQGYGIQIRLEVHGNGTQFLPRVKKIMDAANHDNVRVCWNSNGEDLGGAGLEANFNMVKNKLGDTTHIHDLISNYPWQKLFNLLAGANYQGWTLLEETSATADPIRAMKYYKLLWQYMLGEKSREQGTGNRG